MPLSARSLFWVAALGLFVTFVTIVWRVAVPDGGVWPAVVASFDRAFGDAGPWLLGATGLLAATAWLSDEVARRTPDRRAESFRGTVSGPASAELAAVQERVLARVAGDDRAVATTLDELLRGAIGLGASDVHVTPAHDGVRVTYRLQGELHDVVQLPSELLPRLVTRAKVLARLDTSVRGQPQDGRLRTTLDGGHLEARLSTLPTELGERLVLRIVQGGAVVPSLDALELTEPVRQGLVDVLRRPQGLVFVTGPVGSGKTTTLYACLRHLSHEGGRARNLVTIEDPIELRLPFASQTQVNPRTGLTFAATLRSVLRQDPNVMMIGEIRDPETAEIAVQAGLTGHLILTTVHGSSAAGPFARLMDLRVEPFVLASASLASLSQRLVRTLCTHCRTRGSLFAVERARLEQLGVEAPEDGTIWAPVGCDHCDRTGYVGRLPLAELLLVDGAVREAIHAARPTRDIEECARQAGMRPLLADGLERAARGETSLAEVLRVAG